MNHSQAVYIVDAFQDGGGPVFELVLIPDRCVTLNLKL